MSPSPYSHHTIWSDPGRFAAEMRDWPDDPRALSNLSLAHLSCIAGPAGSFIGAVWRLGWSPISYRKVVDHEGEALDMLRDPRGGCEGGPCVQKVARWAGAAKPLRPVCGGVWALRST